MILTFAILTTSHLARQIHLHFSASHDQEELFDRIMRGDYEYLSPFWDDVSDGPKVSEKT